MASMRVMLVAVRLMISVVVFIGHLPLASPAELVSVASHAFFDPAIGISNNCPGYGFYTHDAFLEAIRSFPNFGNTMSEKDRREVAAFFAHVYFDTTFYCYIEEANKQNPYCNPNATRFPCAPGRFYYGRGPLMLQWKNNYGDAGNYIGFDGLNALHTVANDAVVSFKTAIWCWMRYNSHGAIVLGEGFGETIRRLHGNECGGGNPAKVAARVQNYLENCEKNGVDPGQNLYC